MNANPPFRLRRRVLPAAAAVVAALSLSACGHKEASPHSADTEGPYVRAGNVSYQVQVSRQLNPFSAEDRGYLVGTSTTPPTPNQEWFAVFLWAKNETHQTLTTSNSFDIVDTQGEKYYPVQVNSSINPYTWSAQTLKPLQTQPAPDTTASFGPTQGSVLLFKLNNTIYSNRPLTLEIYANGQSEPTSISLDL